MAEYMEKASEFTREAFFIYSGHHRMIEMTESKRSEDEVSSVIADIIVARMTSKIRRIFEVFPAFADNVGRSLPAFADKCTVSQVQIKGYKERRMT